jgi:hypothetical protein
MRSRVVGVFCLLFSLAVSVLLFSLAVSVPLWAKGNTVLIEVKGETLSTPVRITDAKIEDFTPWAGPGVNGARVPSAEGFIVDWHAGVVRQPAGLQHYEVSFYAGCRSSRQIGQPGPYPPNDPECLAEKPRLVYVVFYEFDPSLSRGFVYLPGRAEAFYFLNMGTIARGCEGNWFLAKDSWEAFMRPLIAQALRQNH